MLGHFLLYSVTGIMVNNDLAVLTNDDCHSILKANQPNNLKYIYHLQFRSSKIYYIELLL